MPARYPGGQLIRSIRSIGGLSVGFIKTPVSALLTAPIPRHRYRRAARCAPRRRASFPSDAPTEHGPAPLGSALAGALRRMASSVPLLGCALRESRQSARTSLVPPSRRAGRGTPAGNAPSSDAASRQVRPGPSVPGWAAATAATPAQRLVRLPAGSGGKSAEWIRQSTANHHHRRRLHRSRGLGKPPWFGGGYLYVYNR